MKLGGLVLLYLCLTHQAHADVTVLLEEPYSYDGAFAGTGHTAIYLTRVCAASPTLLRRCKPGELGVVISRYNRIGQYDWIAIPLLPYLYAVAEPEDIPLYADSKLVAFLRDQYRRENLKSFAPDKPSGETPGGDWVQLVGSAYDRTSYGFQIETTSEQKVIQGRLAELRGLCSRGREFLLPQSDIAGNSRRFRCRHTQTYRKISCEVR